MDGELGDGLILKRPHHVRAGDPRIHPRGQMLPELPLEVQHLIAPAELQDVDRIGVFGDRHEHDVGHLA